MRMRCPVRLGFLAAVSVAGIGMAVGHAALLPSLFPEGVPGYDSAPGVTVRSRLHPELAAPGMRFHALQIQPTLDVSTGYDICGRPHGCKRNLPDGVATWVGSDICPASVQPNSCGPVWEFEGRVQISKARSKRRVINWLPDRVSRPLRHTLLPTALRPRRPHDRARAYAAPTGAV